MSDITQRKLEHIEIVLSDNTVKAGHAAGFESIRFEHVALPELALVDIDLRTELFGHSMNAPLLISSMTGGPARAEDLNQHIAEACNALGIAFGVGSQRIALEGEGSAGFGPELRKRAPNVPILANFGAAQLRQWDGAEMARRAMEMIAADAMIVHLNPLQEAVQAEGDTDWRGILDAIAELCRKSEFPVVVKEVGAGISPRTAAQLVDAGVTAIDVAGAGGTSWAAVEAARAPSDATRRIASAFHDWGIPTAQAVVGARRACPDTTIIASGGIRDGIDCAKAIRLGADVVGLAAAVLPAAITSSDAIVDELNIVIEQLRIACFCTGSGDLTELKTASLLSAPGYVDVTAQ
ncbi:MAG: type 2 isopentenyl-diphosphate Delta-isomerase [Hyphomicrobiaceae bacterium]